jgi:hypothetical protein
MAIARQWVAKCIPIEANAPNSRTSIARQWCSKQALSTVQTAFSVGSVQSGYKRFELWSWQQLLWKNWDRRIRPRDRTRMRMERVLGSHLLWAVVIDCDYERLYKKVLINSVIQSKPIIIHHRAINTWQYVYSLIWGFVELMFFCIIDCIMLSSFVSICFILSLFSVFVCWLCFCGFLFCHSYFLCQLSLSNSK